MNYSPGSISPVLAALEIQASESAKSFYNKIIAYINEFDEQLDQAHEVGARLVNFGQTIQFSIRNIGYHNPKLICSMEN